MTIWLRRLNDLALSHATEPDWPGEVPGDGLLCALVLVPSAMPRNRFYPLFARAEAQRARARAAQVRAAIRHLAGRYRFAIRLLDLAPNERGIFRLRYLLPEIKLDRSVWLDPLELSVLRLAFERIGSGFVSAVRSPVRPVPDELNERGDCDDEFHPSGVAEPAVDTVHGTATSIAIPGIAGSDVASGPERLGVLADPRLRPTEEDRRRVDEALLQLWSVLDGPLDAPKGCHERDNPGGG